MLVTWQPGKPVSCDEHGQISDSPPGKFEGAILMLEHLQDAHGQNVAAALAKVKASAAQEAQAEA
jgi:hypothetical protein